MNPEGRRRRAQRVSPSSAKSSKGQTSGTPSRAPGRAGLAQARAAAVPSGNTAAWACAGRLWIALYSDTEGPGHCQGGAVVELQEELQGPGGGPWDGRGRGDAVVPGAQWTTVGKAREGRGARGTPTARGGGGGWKRGSPSPEGDSGSGSATPGAYSRAATLNPKSKSQREQGSGPGAGKGGLGREEEEEGRGWLNDPRSFHSAPFPSGRRKSSSRARGLARRTHCWHRPGGSRKPGKGEGRSPPRPRRAPRCPRSRRPSSGRWPSRAAES